MRAQDLYEKVIGYMPNGKVPSLPFIQSTAQNLKRIVWFYYSMEQDAQDLLVHIREVLTADEALQVSTTDIVMDLRKTVGDYLKPQMEIAEYYEQLEKLYTFYDAEKMQMLLKSAEAEPLWEVYEKVADFLKAEDKDEETEKPEKKDTISEAMDILINAFKKND